MCVYADFQSWQKHIAGDLCETIFSRQFNDFLFLPNVFPKLRKRSDLLRKTAFVWPRKNYPNFLIVSNEYALDPSVCKKNYLAFWLL